MEKIETAIPGVYILEPKLFRDERGYFVETWNAKTLKDLGINAQFVQDNESLSSYGVLRGLHYQKGEFSQAKLVRVIEGEVVDIALDIRAGSPTFGKHVAVRLSGENHRQFFIPKGFAHGFAVLSERAVFAYKCDGFYAPQSEGCILADDPDVGIEWPVPAGKRIYSAKDRRGLTFKDYCRNPAFRYEDFK